MATEFCLLNSIWPLWRKKEITCYSEFYMKTFTYLDSANLLFGSCLLNDLPAPYVGSMREGVHMIELMGKLTLN